MVDALPPEIVARITASPRWREVAFEPVVDSTNTEARRRAEAGDAPGLVVVAERQTAGRGRLDRSWLDQPGGSLAVTALVEPPDPATLAPIAAGLAVVDAAAAQGVEATLKWPNDVLVDQRKASGILVETVAAGLLAVGIGVNVDWRDRDGRVDEAWGSLAEGAGHDIDRWRVLADLLRALDGHLGQDPDALVGTYRGRCATLGRDVRVELASGVIEGVAADVGADGSLRVRTVDGVVEVQAGDVHHLRPA